MTDHLIDPNLSHSVGGAGLRFLRDMDTWADERLGYQDTGPPFQPWLPNVQPTIKTQTEAKVNNRETHLCNQSRPAILCNGTG